MRKFVVSDLHGNGNVYNSIMNYLDNIKKNEDIIIYINGDLIDRGPDSARMLLDIKDRIQNHENIVYLGGNHELMMHQIFKARKYEHITYYNPWYRNGGYVTDEGLWFLLDGNKDKILEIADYVSNLKIYEKLEDRINGKPIVIVHAACPDKVKDNCDLKIKDDNLLIDELVLTRLNYPSLNYRDNIGNSKYFTLIGHTPLNEKYGYKYYKNQNYMNIDGGCAPYVCGDFKYDHTPLVEIKNDYLKILTFNNNNEIIYGNFFIEGRSIPMNEIELENERKYLNKELIIKKLIKDVDGLTYYKD